MTSMYAQGSFLSYLDFEGNADLPWDHQYKRSLPHHLTTVANYYMASMYHLSTDFNFVQMKFDEKRT